ncbi:hypothetical protein ACLK1S_23420 [Escherichia coli]
MKIISMRSGGWPTSALPAPEGIDLYAVKECCQHRELVRPEPSRFSPELPQDDLIWEQERKVVSAEERMQKGKAIWRIS